MADFLLELRSEEIPARMQPRARNELARMFAECTSEAGLETGAIEAFSTPRRLVLIARDVAGQTEAVREEIKGPRSSAPPQALEGFLRKTGLTQDQLEDRDGVYFAIVERPGRAAAEVLAGIVERIVADFSWPKSMRWGSGDLRWVRPLHGIVAMLGEEIVLVEIDGISSGASTVGHRFHHPGPITVGGASDYIEKLRACHVIVDQDERETLIRDGAEAAAKGAGLSLLCDEGLVVENAGLTEWPVPLLGEFDSDYLDVPREVIVLTMRTNQKYFACTASDGGLAPAFVCVANIDASDGGAAIVEGNRRVLAARLSDARFFWQQDLKVPLEEQAAKLGGIVFHDKLGTVADKVERVAKLARWLVEEGVVQADADQVERAARLAKADLVTGMVGEFPELQGAIGGYLAEAQGEPKAVADAIRDHYKPVGQGDDVPTAPVTVAVALADKIDTIVGFFAIDERPTGSKDPYAVRRAALGAISLVLANNLRIHVIGLCANALMGVVEAAYDMSHVLKSDIERQTKALRDVQKLRETGLGDSDAIKVELSALTVEESQNRVAASLLKLVRDKFAKGSQAFIDEISDFFADRLKVQQREAGVRHDLIDAVFALGEDDLVRLLARVNALQSFVDTEDGTNLLTAYKRAANILKAERVKGELSLLPITSETARKLYDLEDSEKELLAALDVVKPTAEKRIEMEAFGSAMEELAKLRTPIDVFFDKVMVNDADETKRIARLSMLDRFVRSVNAVADFSKIEG